MFSVSLCFIYQLTYWDFQGLKGGYFIIIITSYMYASVYMCLRIGAPKAKRSHIPGVIPGCESPLMGARNQIQAL